VFSPDGPRGEAGMGFLWNAAERAHLSFRSYFAGPTVLPHGQGGSLREPRKADQKSIDIQFKEFLEHGDPYVPALDLGFSQRIATGMPDFWRVKEWLTEFRDFETHDNLPSLEIIYLPNDHFGNFGAALDGVDTPETQMADNDYAVGTIVEAV